MAQLPPAPPSGFSRRFGERIIAMRHVTIFTAIILALAAAGGSVHLKHSSDYRDFFSEDNPELRAFEALEDTFEKNDNVLVMIAPADRDATSQQSLEAAIWMTERLWQTPYSSRVSSIANFPHTIADEDGILVQDLVDPHRIDDASVRRHIRATALADPRLAGLLLAHDGSVSAVNLAVQIPDGDSAVAITEIATFVAQATAEAREMFPGIDFRTAGTVIINHAFTEATAKTRTTVLPAAIVVMAIIIGFLTRGFTGVVATGGVVFLSMFATMGVAGWVGIPLSTSTAVTPVIILALAVANCLHVLASVRDGLGAGESRQDAVINSVQTNLYPIFLASVTTAFGFLMMNLSEVPPYRQLGTLVAIGSGIVFVLSMTFLPAVLSMVPMRPSKANGSGFGIMAIAELTIRRRRSLLLLSAVVILGLAAAIPRNELNDVLTRFFNEDVQLRKDTDFLDARLNGNTAIEYSVSAGTSNGVADPGFLHDVSEFADWLRSRPETRHVFVISDTFRQLNQSMNGGSPEFYRIPESRELASQLLLLYELSLPFGLDLNNRIDVSKSTTRLTVTTRTLSSRELLAFDARTHAWLEESGLDFAEVASSGASLIVSHLGHRNIRAMLLGTAIAFLGVSMLLILAFRSLRFGLISLLPNFVPGLLGFGVWGLLVGEVGLVLSVVMAMTIGIVVDDTVHFLSKYLHARKDLNFAPEDSVRYAFRTVGSALFATTTILVAGFLVLGLSDFFPTAQMGQLTALVIAFALIYDFLFLPPLLLTFDRVCPRRSPTLS